MKVELRVLRWARLFLQFLSQNRNQFKYVLMELSLFSDLKEQKRGSKRRKWRTRDRVGRRRVFAFTHSATLFGFVFARMFRHEIA